MKLFHSLFLTAVSGLIVKKSSSVKFSLDSTKPRQESLPAILYIVFDEHIAINGVPDNIPEAVLAKKEMKDFYDKFGFLLFKNAYSHYSWSEHSITNTLNFTSTLPSGFAFEPRA